MRTFLLAVVLMAFAACENAGNVKAGIDTAVSDVKNSKVLDSIEAKGERILDTVKARGGVLLDSSKRKGGRLLNGAGEGLKRLSKKLDSTK